MRVESESPRASGPRLALCLPGGGATGAMFQIGALTALEDSVDGFDATQLDLYLGASSGACVCAALAGGQPVARLYRAFIDPADVYFPLQRSHLFRMDIGEWRRVLGAALGALGHGSQSLLSRSAPPSPKALWEQLDRFYDSLPAGVFTLDRFERFLASVFDRRSVKNSFPALGRQLYVLAHDLDSGERVLFGEPGFDHVPVSRACVASMALPPFFSPVRIGDRHYIDTGAAQLSLLDAAVDLGADVLVIVNPMVPVDVDHVPTGHGKRGSVRDKGYMWVANQAIRIGMHTLLDQAVERIRGQGKDVILIEPDPSDAILFMYNPASFAARRQILEYAYKTTRQRVARWLEGGAAALDRAGWRTRPAGASVPPPAAD